MKRRIEIAAFFIIVIAVQLLAVDIEQIEPKSYSDWVTPSPTDQIYLEGLDDQKGMGRIFVPAMTVGETEPQYAIFHDGEQIGEQNTGSSFFLLPGEYTVRLGTGTIDQRISRTVKVVAEQTVIIKPDWCALTVEIIDELRNYVKQDLQIYRIETLESYGIIPAINLELGEKLLTVIVPPGLYKIVERGRDINTLENFTTLRLVPGTFTPYTIVINSQTRSFTGAGILTSTSQLRQRRDFSLFGAFHGSVILNSANDVSSEEPKTNITILTQVENRVQYDKPPHFYSSRNLLELGALRQQEESFQISQDRLQLKNTYVYYILNWLGGYMRFETTTHLFPTYKQFDTSRDVTLRSLSGEDELKTGVREINLEPSIFPLGLKEGVGVNLTPLRTFKARLNIRSGFGFRQTYNNNVYQQSVDSDTLYTRISNSVLRGLETSIVSNLSLLRNLNITTELDILFPIGSETRPVIDFENIASVAVTRNLSVEYILRLNRIQDLNWTVQEQFVSVRISYFIF